MLPVHCFDSGVIAACEDIFNGSPASDIMNLINHEGIVFFLIKNAGAVGTATVTVAACSDNAASASDNIGFRYLKVQDPATAGTWTAVAYADADTGFTTAAEADVIYAIDVRRSDLVSGYGYVKLTCTEVDSTAVDGCAMAILYGSSYPGASPADSPSVTGD
jgi:hypothetical protein